MSLPADRSRSIVAGSLVYLLLEDDSNHLSLVLSRDDDACVQSSSVVSGVNRMTMFCFVFLSFVFCVLCFAALFAKFEKITIHNGPVLLHFDNDYQ